MALLGNLFKGRGEKKPPEKQPSPPPSPAPAKSQPAPAAATSSAPAPRPAPASAAVPPKAIELDAIVSALKQIEEAMGGGGGVAGAVSDTLSEDLYSVSLKLGDLVKIMPSAFRPLPGGTDESEVCEVLVEKLFDQLAKGKVSTKLEYFVAGVSPQLVAQDVEERGNTPVNLPLAMVVAAIDPDELKRRTASIEKATQAKELPNLFGAGAGAKGAIAVPKPGAPAAATTAKPSGGVKAVAPPPSKPAEPPKPVGAVKPSPPAVPAKPAEPPKPAPVVAKPAEPPPPTPVVARPAEPVKPAPPPAPVRPVVQRPPAESLPETLMPIAEMARLLPGAFTKAAASSTAKAAVLVEGLFDQLSKGKVQTTVARFLAHVPTELLAEGVDLASGEPVSLPLAMVVQGIPRDELVKRTTTKARDLPVREIPNLFVQGDGKPAAKQPAEAPKAAAAVPPADKPAATAVPATEAPKPELKLAKPAEKKPVVPFQAPVPKAAPVVPDEALKPPEPIKPAAMAPRPVVAKAEPPKPAPVPMAEAPKPVVPPAAIEPPKKIAIPLFMEEPAAVPAPEAPKPVAEPPAKAVAQPAPAPAPVAAVKPPPVEKPAAAPVVQSGGEGIPAVMMRGVDLNTASVEELCRIDGVGQKLAEKMVQERVSGGPFFGYYDLARVAGIGRKAFEKITGLPWREEQYGQLELVNRMLEHKGGGLPDLKEVAGRFKELPGIEGCAILHRDGHLLATSWEAKPSEALQAMAPQIFKRVAYYMRHISPEETMGVTVSLPDRALTFAQSQDICFIAIHSPKGITRRHMQIVQGVCLALGHRFSGGK